MATHFSKSSLVLITLGIAVLLLVVSSLTTYNSLVAQDEEANTAWSNLQSQYQRRSDLIPNLVNTVKGYASHESKTLEEVVAARAKATSLTVSAESLTPERARQIQQAQGELSTLVGRLLSITENYPDLKANQNFSELQAQLEGTENRINESRRLYNESVRSYNVSIRRFPASIIASIFGFDKKTPFEAQQGADIAPTVAF